MTGKCPGVSLLRGKCPGVNVLGASARGVSVLGVALGGGSNCPVTRLHVVVDNLVFPALHSTDIGPGYTYEIS